MPTLKLRYIVVLVLCIGSGLQSLLNNFAKIDVEKKNLFIIDEKNQTLNLCLFFQNGVQTKKLLKYTLSPIQVLH